MTSDPFNVTIFDGNNNALYYFNQTVGPTVTMTSVSVVTLFLLAFAMVVVALAAVGVALV